MPNEFGLPSNSLPQKRLEDCRVTLEFGLIKERCESAGLLQGGDHQQSSYKSSHMFITRVFTAEEYHSEVLELLLIQLVVLRAGLTLIVVE